MARADLIRAIDGTGLPASQRPLLVAGVTLALRGGYAGGDAEQWLAAISTALPFRGEDAERVLGQFKGVTANPAVRDDLASLTARVADLIPRDAHDAPGLVYSPADRQGLGIVLTPWHVAQLMTELAGVQQGDVVADLTCGSGVLLAAARERGAQVVGVEQQPHMLALAAANLPEAALHLGDALTVPIAADRVLLNPPYSQKGASELAFIERALDVLAPGGLCVAIVPMSCALRGQLMASHTLEAVMSMPDELFNPDASVVTCIMVWRARTPHNFSKPTWFGYWKDDGFEKRKHVGRVDAKGRWEAIREQWLADYRGRVDAAGRSALECVTADDEWCAEAYMATDYSTITREVFEAVVRDYAIYRMMNSPRVSVEPELPAAPVSPEQPKKRTRRRDAIDAEPLFAMGVS